MGCLRVTVACQGCSPSHGIVLNSYPILLSHWLGEAQEKSDLRVNVAVDPDSGNLTVASYVPLEEDLCPSHSSLYPE